MEKIKIDITQAQIESLRISFDQSGKGIDLSVNIGLYTDHNRHITTFSMSTDAWRDKDKIEIPPGIYAPIMKIAKIVEQSVVEQYKGKVKELEAPND